MISDVFWFFQGNMRYFLVKCFGLGVLRRHIREQVVARVMSAHVECVRSGRCRMCGCHTPALFYAGKSCDGDCYPRMMGSADWELFKVLGGDDMFLWADDKFVRMEEFCDGEQVC